MKLVGFIFSFIMIGLSILPCGDDDVETGARSPQLQITHQPSHQDEPDDICSPFCHCTCCAVYSIDHLHTLSTAMIPASVIVNSSYLPGKLLRLPSSIWQPPKIG